MHMVTYTKRAMRTHAETHVSKQKVMYVSAAVNNCDQRMIGLLSCPPVNGGEESGSDTVNTF